MNRLKRIGMWRVLLTPLVFLVSGSIFFNCSDVRLEARKSKEVTSVQAAMTSQLPAPKAKPPQLRLLVFMDQSYSMLWQRCDIDVDGPTPHNKPLSGGLPSCTPDVGADQDADRYAVLQAWLDELVGATFDIDADNIKVAIIPFSGGLHERPNQEDRADLENRFAFLNLRKAQAWKDKLLIEHNRDLQTTRSAIQNSTDYMGTTVPLTTLNVAADLIRNEMADLKSQEKLEATPFHFIYVSDGVFKPIEPYLEVVRREVGCPTSCANEPNHPACQNYRYCYPMCPKQFCESTLFSEFKRIFGEPANNKLDLIASALNSIMDIPKAYKGATLTSHLVKVNPIKVPPYDRPSPELNIFDEVYKENKEFYRASIIGPEPPFSVLSLGGTHVTYKLDEFYVLNLNAYYDTQGNLVADSDGDGLSDIQEKNLGYDPVNPRSQSVCLDGIFHYHGCRSISCDPLYDRDGDSLNDCEEKTVQTNTKRIDSDDDQILDLHELLRGLNPNADQSQTTSANDGYTDHEHFYMGLHPRTRVYQLDGVKPIEIEMVFKRYDTIKNESGVPFMTAVYQATVNHIPIKRTLGTSDFEVYRRYDDSKNLERYVGPLPHEEDINHILFLAKVAANEDPKDFYWLVLREEVPAVDFPGEVFHIEVDFSKFKRIDLEIGED